MARAVDDDGNDVRAFELSVKCVMMIRDDLCTTLTKCKCSVILCFRGVDDEVTDINIFGAITRPVWLPFDNQLTTSEKTIGAIGQLSGIGIRFVKSNRSQIAYCCAKTEKYVRK